MAAHRSINAIAVITTRAQSMTEGKLTRGGGGVSQSLVPGHLWSQVLSWGGGGVLGQGTLSPSQDQNRGGGTPVRSQVRIPPPRARTRMGRGGGEGVPKPGPRSGCFLFLMAIICDLKIYLIMSKPHSVKLFSL